MQMAIYLFFYILSRGPRSGPYCPGLTLTRYMKKKQVLQFTWSLLPQKNL